MKKIILLSALLFGCSQMDELDRSRLERNANSVVYIKDHRTQLCYASYWGINLGTFTNVPCTSEVEKLIK